MTDAYLLEQLLDKGAKMRKAQTDYYAYRKPLEDPLKRSYLQEAQRREQDFDRLVVTITTARPDLAEKLTAAANGTKG